MTAYSINGSVVLPTNGVYQLTTDSYNFLKFTFEYPRQRLIVDTLPVDSVFVFNLLGKEQIITFACYSTNTGYTIITEDKIETFQAGNFIFDVIKSPFQNSTVAIYLGSNLFYLANFATKEPQVEFFFSSNQNQTLPITTEILEYYTVSSSNYDYLTSLSYTFNLSNVNFIDYIIDTANYSKHINITNGNSAYEMILTSGQNSLECYGEYNFAALPYQVRHFRLQILDINNQQFVALYAAGVLLCMEKLPFYSANPTVNFTINSATPNSIVIYKTGKISSSYTTSQSISDDGFVSIPQNTVLINYLTTSLTIGAQFQNSFTLTVQTDVEEKQILISNDNGYVKINDTTTLLPTQKQSRLLLKTEKGILEAIVGENKISIGIGNFITKVTLLNDATLLCPLPYHNSNVLSSNTEYIYSSLDKKLYFIPENSTGNVEVSTTEAGATIVFNTQANIDFEGQVIPLLTNVVFSFINNASNGYSFRLISKNNVNYFISPALLYSNSQTYYLTFLANTNIVVFEDELSVQKISGAFKVIKNVTNTVQTQHNTLHTISNKLVAFDSVNLVSSLKLSEKIANNSVIANNAKQDILSSLTNSNALTHLDAMNLSGGNSQTNKVSKLSIVANKLERLGFNQLSNSSSVSSALSAVNQISRTITRHSGSNINIGKQTAQSFSGLKNVAAKLSQLSSSLKFVALKSIRNTLGRFEIGNQSTNRQPLNIVTSHIRTFAGSLTENVANRIHKLVLSVLQTSNLISTKYDALSTVTNLIKQVTVTNINTANKVAKKLNSAINVINKVSKNIVKALQNIIQAGRAPLLAVEQMYNFLYAASEYFGDTITNLNYSLATKLGYVIAENADKIKNKILSSVKHRHEKYLSKDSIAQSSYKLSEISNFVTNKHTHDTYVSKRELLNYGNESIYITEQASTLNRKVSESFSRREHSHSLEKKRRISQNGKEITVANSASNYLIDGVTKQIGNPESFFATANHLHQGEYTMRGKPVRLAKVIKNGSITYGVANAFVQLAESNHTHPEYDLRGLKIKLQDLDLTNKVKNLGFTLIRYKYPENNSSKTWLQQLQMRLQFLLKTKFPNEGIYSSTPLLSSEKAPVVFSLWVTDAFKLFVGGYDDTTTYRLTYGSTSLLAQVLKKIGIDSSVITDVTIKIPVNKYHYSYFVQSQRINYQFNEQPYYVFLAPFTYTQSMDKYITQIVEQFNVYYPHTLQLMRIISGLSPADNLQKTPNNLMMFGVGTSTSYELEVFNGGFPYNILVLTKR